MNHIGSIITVLREEKKITRAQLAQGICSEKYIYMIETGQRNPSAEILMELSNKLNDNLFNYMTFLDHQNPVHVAQTLSLLREKQRQSDYKAIKEITDQVLKDPDFLIKPNYYHFFYYSLTHDILVERKLEESFERLKEVLEDAGKNYSDNIFIMTANSLLAVTAQMMGEYDQALFYIKKANNFIKHNSINMQLHQHTCIRVKITLISVLFRTGNYKEAIEEGLKTLEIQNRDDLLSLVFFTHIYLSFALFADNQIKEAMQHFHKGLFFLMNNYSEIDVKLLTEEEYLHKLCKHPESNKTILSFFEDHYNLKLEKY